MTTRRYSLCIIGNMLGRTPGFVTTQGQILSELFSRDGWSVRSASSKQNRILRLADMAATVVESKFKSDLLILEVYSGLSMVIADTIGLLCTLLRIPSVFVLHGGNLPDFSRRWPRWTRRVLQRASVLIAPSDFLAAEMRRFGFEVSVIPNVIDIGKYRFRVRREVEPKLLWMRAFHPIYNPQMAIRTFARLKRSYPQASLVMAGVDKGLEAEIKAEAEKSNLADSISFPGFLNETAKSHEFSRADMFLNTNKIDNMPVAIVEACASGLPVVATDVGGIRYILRNRENALLVADDDDKAMARAVEDLIKDPALAERCSRGGRVLAEASSWENVREQWQKVFDHVVQREPFAVPVSQPVK